MPSLQLQTVSDHLGWHEQGDTDVLGLQLHATCQGPHGFASAYTTLRNTSVISKTIWLRLGSSRFCSRSDWVVSPGDINRDVAGVSTPAYLRPLVAALISASPRDMAFLYFLNDGVGDNFRDFFLSVPIIIVFTP